MKVTICMALARDGADDMGRFDDALASYDHALKSAG
jgi:hypothetical protein